MSSRALYPRRKARSSDGSMSPRSSDGDMSPRSQGDLSPWSHDDASPRSDGDASSPKLRFYEEEHSPRSITAVCMPWSMQRAPAPLVLPPAFSSFTSPSRIQEEESVHKSGGGAAEWDRGWFEERPCPVPWSLTSDDHVKFVAMCERKRRSSRELADDLEDMSRSDRVRYRFRYFILACAAALLLLAAVMPLSLVLHPPSPPAKSNAALFQPLWMMHYEFDPDMFDNFWFPLFT